MASKKNLSALTTLWLRRKVPDFLYFMLESIRILTENETIWSSCFEPQKYRTIPLLAEFDQISIVKDKRVDFELVSGG